MQKNSTAWNEERMRQIMGSLLRIGLLTAAIIVILGGILYFIQHTKDAVSYAAFSGEPDRLTKIDQIIGGAINLRSRAVIQFGLLLLIATPFARVVFSFIGFIIEKDWIYTVITFIVLIILFFSLFNIV